MNFGSAGQDELYNDDLGGNGDTLTLGSGLTITAGGGTDYLENNSDDDTIVNAGKIIVTAGEVIALSGSFTNSGSILISGGAEVALSNPVLTNTGSISIGAGSELLIGTGFTNTGSISLGSGATLDLTGYVTLAELTEPAKITSSGGTVEVDGGGTLDLGGGTLDVTATGEFSTVLVNSYYYGNYNANNGTLANGTVKLAGGSVLFSNYYNYSYPYYGEPTLDDVTWQGTLALGASTAIDVLGGLTLETASGGSHGNIDLTAGYDQIYVLDSEALNNATLDFGSAGGDSLDTFDASDFGGAGETLTLGRGFTITLSGGTDTLSNFDENTGDTIDNAGSIEVTGGELVAQFGSFINSGSITISGGAEADLSSPTLTNTGSIDVGADSELVIGTGFTNTGSISFGSGTTLELTGYVTLAELEGPGTITDSGDALMVAQVTTFDLGGSTLDVASIGLFSDILVYGTLANGTVKLDGGSVTFSSPYYNGFSYQPALDDVTWQGTLALATNTALNILGGLTVETVSGGSPGSIDLSAGGDALYVLDTETLNNSTLNFGSANNGYLYNVDNAGSGQTLTLGSGFTIIMSGGYNYLDNYNQYTGDTIANAGQINLTGGELLIQYGSFTNTGSIAISGGAEVDLSDTTLTNTGSISIGADSELRLGAGFTNTGSISLGSGAILDLTGYVTLAELTAAGKITNSSGTVEVDGYLDLGGGKLDATATGEFSTVLVNTYGTLANGTVTLAGGTVLFTGGGNYPVYSPGYNPTLVGVTWQGTLALGADTGLDIFGGLTLESASGGIPGSIDLSAGGDYLFVQDNETLNNAVLNFGSLGGDSLQNAFYNSGHITNLKLGSGFTLAALGGTDTLSNDYVNGTITSAGTIDVTGGDLVAQIGLLINNGSILVSNGEADLSGIRFTNSGSVLIGGGGHVLLSSSAVNTGGMTINDGGTLEIKASFAGNVAFGSSGGTLALDDSLAYTGTIYNFVNGDTIDLTNIAYHINGSATLLAGNTLQVIEGSTTLDLKLDPSQNFTGDFFHTAPDGTAITVSGAPLVTFTWANPISDDWSNASDWTPSGGPPRTTTNAALIDVAGTYTVGLADGDSYLVNAVTLNVAGATLDVALGGTLALGGATPTLIDSAGTFELAGTLLGGTVDVAGGSVLFSSPYYSTPNYAYNPTLDGVTWLGTLALGAYSGLDIVGGLTVETASGATPGIIDLSAGNDYLYAQGSETLNNATLNLGSLGGDYLYNDDISGAGQTLRLGSGFTIAVSGGTDYLSNYYNYSNDAIVDSGTIDISGGDLAAQSGSFTNSGSIAISGGGIVDLSDTKAINSGSINVGAGSELVTGSGFTNSGSISLGSGATLDLTGSVTLAGLGKISNSGGTLRVDGTLDLGGGTLDVTATGAFSTVLVAGTPYNLGTIAYGTVNLAGGIVLFSNAYYYYSYGGNPTLDDVTWQGTLALTDDVSIDIEGGLTLETLAGGSHGIMDLSAGGDYVFVLDSETLNNATMNFGSVGGNSLDTYNPGGPVETLTLGSGFTITLSGGTDYFDNLTGYSNDSLVNDGTIDISGGELVVTNGFTNAGSISVTGGALDVTGYVTLAELDGTGEVTTNGGSLQIDGTLDLAGGTLDVTSGGISSLVVESDGTLANGTLKLDTGSVVLNSNATLSGMTIQGAGTLGAGVAVNILGGLTVETQSGSLPGTVDLSAGNDSINVLDSETLNNATVNFGSLGGDALYNDDYNGGHITTLKLGSGFTLASGGGTDYLSNIYTNGTISSAGTIDVTGGDLVAQTGLLINTGSILVSNALADFSGIRFTNSGSVVIGTGGHVLLSSSAVNTGGMTIGDGGTLEVKASFAGNVAFGSAGGTLTLDDSLAYTGTIDNFLTGDTIDLTNIAYHINGGATLLAGNTLQVIEAATTLDLKLDPTQDFTGLYFHTAPDGVAITVDDHVLCFLPDTLIATPDGDTFVQRLAVGDLVRTAGGGVRPIAWIGHGRVLAPRGRRTAATPVVVCKDALAPGVPYHDLRVTKGHSFLIDDVLIPVEFLVNHRSIHWDDHAREVSLYHIELDAHDVLLANGAPAESYRDDGNRWLFRNANQGWDLPPKPPCAPVLTGGPVVDAAWQRLLDRAGPRPGLPLTDDPDLHLVADGRRVDATERYGQCLGFSLPSVPDCVRVVSRAASPQELGLGRDARSLGVALGRITISQGAVSRRIEPDDPLLGGLHGVEPANPFRWTAGDAVLPRALFAGFDDGPVDVVLRCAATARYIEEGPTRQAA